MQRYLFVHFKEKTTPDGEQVYFALSKDGFSWEALNEGNPVLWAYYGDKGVRDFTIVRGKNKFYIIATDLSLSYGMRNQYKHSWKEIGENGSKCFSVWESEDLVNWSEQKLVKIGDENFGCLWAPDVIYDTKKEDYVLHWSSSHKCNGFGDKGIYYSRTKDFEAFTYPEVLHRRDGRDIIDSAMYEENGIYYMFVKDGHPTTIVMLKAESPVGPWERVEAFDESMKSVEVGLYEAPTAVKLDDGRWCLFLDYYGRPGKEQGYVPFISEDISSGVFTRSDESFNFPYGFKHGTILAITEEEYERMKDHDWNNIPDGR